MESGFKILWTDHALSELATTFEYLELHFSEKEMTRLSRELDKLLYLITLNPSLFPLSEKNEVRRAVLLKYNTIYYKVEGNLIVILSFFANRQNPEKRKI